MIHEASHHRITSAERPFEIRRQNEGIITICRAAITAL